MDATVKTQTDETVKTQTDASVARVGTETGVRAGREAGAGTETERGCRRKSLLVGERTLLKIGQKGYPDAFMQIPDPPRSLYVVGEVEALEEGLAVIGARKATPYGLSCAKRFATMAAERGIVIVSGGALGCDSAAHRAALDAGGRTVVILGGGCDEIYPSRNRGLFQEVIEKGGAVVSEQGWKVPPLKYMFRRRNRLIAGLSRALLIVEAGLPSGTFSTADEAISANKEVLVVPGAITSPTSRGTNRLLYQGATPIVDDEGFEDMLFSVFGYLKSAKRVQSIEAGDDPILAAIRAQAMSAEKLLDLMPEEKAIANRISKLMTHLSELQRARLIKAYPDGTFGPAEEAFL